MALIVCSVGFAAGVFLLLQNMYIKDEPAPGSSGGGNIKRARTSGGYTGASSGGCQLLPAC
jgi:hypothetical protein